MALYTDTKALERIVKERARQLRREGSGYIAAVNVIVDELYRGAHGEVTPIVVMGLMAKVPWNEILKLIGRLLSFLHDLWRQWVSGKDREREERERLHALVSPWISAVYEQ